MDTTHGGGASTGPSAVKPTHTDVESSSSSFMNADLPSGSKSYCSINETTNTDDATMATLPNVPVSLPTIADEEVSKDTPVKAKQIMERYTHCGSEAAKDSALGYAQTASVNGFEDYYLREAKAIQTAEWRRYKVYFLRNLQGATSKKQLYSLLTKISLSVCKGKARCLAFYDTSGKECFSGFEVSKLRLDIIVKWATHVNAARIVRGNTSGFGVHWHEIQSLVGVKQNFNDRSPRNQAGQYLHVLPLELPSLSGMLYLALDKFKFYIYWSDTSGIVRSHHHDITEDKSWDVLFRYVLTVVESLENLPTWDPTTTFNVENPSKPEWVIASNNEALTTSDLHSGAECVLEFDYKRRVFRRTKYRNVLKTKGDSLSKRTSFLQVIMAIYDGIQGQQIRVNEKKVKHRDVSRNKIVSNPIHHDAKLDGIPGTKYINQILHSDTKQFREEHALIDWVIATDLGDRNVGDALTDRMGTPMFVSISAGIGTIKQGSRTRGKFPRLEGEAKQLYTRAFGQKNYDEYIEAVEQTADYMRPDEVKDPRYKHAPLHDMESFFWVLVYELLLAWPEDEDRCLSQNIASLVKQFKDHSFSKGGIDFRVHVLLQKKDYWEEVLHPRLRCLAGVLADMAAYFAPEWAFWTTLPEDHAHEAFKRLLFAAAWILKSDSIPLRAKEKNLMRYSDSIQHYSR